MQKQIFCMPFLTARGRDCVGKEGECVEKGREFVGKGRDCVGKEGALPEKTGMIRESASEKGNHWIFLYKDAMIYV